MSNKLVLDNLVELISKERKILEKSMNGSMGKIVEIDLHNDHAERNGEWVEIAVKLSNAQQMKKHFSVVEEDLKKKLKVLSDDTSSKGGDFVFTRFMSKGSVDYGAIPQLSGIDLDSYRKEGFSRWKLTKI